MGTHSCAKADSAEASVIEANVRFYQDIASKYDQYESCASNAKLQELSRRDLDRIGILLGRRTRPVECLDCGGGSGNLTLKMLEKGWTVSVVDVSSDMLSVLRQKAHFQGFSVSLVQSSIGDFLAGSLSTYDVVTFNSVLHHLYSYLPVVAQVADRVREGGIFYSNYDPVIPRFRALNRAFESIDTAIAKIAHDPSDFVPGALRRVKKLLRKRDVVHARAVLSAGDLAEYHARTGIDDSKIIEVLKSKGLEIQEHVRWTSGRTWATRHLNKYLKLMETVKIIGRRQSNGRSMDDGG